MKRSSIALAAVCAFVGGSALVLAQNHGRDNDSRGDSHGEPPAAIHWSREIHSSREHAPLGFFSRRSPNLTYNGGPVMHGTFVEPIFWGPSWGNATFVGDKISGLQSFYSGMNGSTYAATNTEYTDPTGHVSTSITMGAVITDLSTVTTNGQTTTPILNEVCSHVTNPVANGYYPVYVDRKRGSAGFCAWHSAATCSGVTVQFAFFFNLDGDAGCDPRDTSGLHSQGLAALANVSGHELSETLTDRHLDAWYDPSGSENADKCAWSFGTPLLNFNGSQFKVQGNWSNAAYNTSHGYPNGSGQRGCLDGGNYK